MQKALFRRSGFGVRFSRALFQTSDYDNEVRSVSSALIRSLAPQPRSRGRQGDGIRGKPQNQKLRLGRCPLGRRRRCSSRYRRMGRAFGTKNKYFGWRFSWFFFFRSFLYPRTRRSSEEITGPTCRAGSATATVDSARMVERGSEMFRGILLNVLA